MGSAHDGVIGQKEGTATREAGRQSARGVGVQWTRWSYVYLRTDELTPEAAQQQQLVLVLGPLPPPLQQRPLPPLLLPPLMLPLKPKRTPPRGALSSEPLR